MNPHKTCTLLNSKHYMFVTRHWSILHKIVRSDKLFIFLNIQQKQIQSWQNFKTRKQKLRSQKLLFVSHTLYTFQHYMKKLLKYIRYFEEKIAICVIQVYRKNIIIFNAEYKLTIPTYNINKQISCFNVLHSKRFNL